MASAVSKFSAVMVKIRLRCSAGRAWIYGFQTTMKGLDALEGEELTFSLLTSLLASLSVIISKESVEQPSIL